MPENLSRKLAAIMFADLEGYTALMQEDESLARACRDRQREVLQAVVPEHRGEILQYYGDGALTVFRSAVEAVECAVVVQLRLREDPAVPVRIGVHTGDIVQEDGGVYGDGVNVAARIEALAAPGGIMISGKVFDEIKNHPDLAAKAMGPVLLKNVGHPVSVFAISSSGLPVPTEDQLREKSASAKGNGSPGTDAAWDWPAPPASPPEGPGEAFLKNVKERALIPWAVVYLLGAWIFLQATGFLGEHFNWAPGVRSGLGILTFVGFIVTLVVAWHHGERGRQPVTPREVVIISGLLTLGLASLFLAQGESPASSGSAAREFVAEGKPSVAVLPFDNFSPDPDDAYVANGVQEDLTTALSRINAIRVPGRSSVDRFRQNRPGTLEMAEALGVDFLLEGSASVVGEEVRIAVQLIDGRTDQHIWAEDYDYPFSVDRVIEVRTALAREVATRLRAIITPEEQERISQVPTQVAEAFQLYQRARYRWNQRTETDVREALRLFQAAIDLDPGFAEAYAGLADTYLVLSNWGWIDHRDGHRRGIAAAERALTLDPSNASANASLGALYLWSTRDWSRSESHFLRASELDPEYAYTHYWYSALLSALGRHEESIQQALEAESLDPLSPQISYGVSRSLFLARRYEEALEHSRQTLEVNPDYGPLLAQVCRCDLLLGDFAAAEAACLREKEVSGSGRTLSMALVRALQGDREGALTEVEGLSGQQTSGGPQPIFVAMVFAGLGEVDEAFRWLEEAFDDDYPYLEYLPSNPFFDPLRDDPRYTALLNRIGL